MRPDQGLRRFAWAWVAFAIFALTDGQARTSDDASSFVAWSSSHIAAETCESRTVNYITHTLPQQCLRTAWRSTGTSSIITPSGGPEATPEGELGHGHGHGHELPQNKQDEPPGAKEAGAVQEKDGRAKEDETDEEDPHDLATSSFMSFEEWKEMMLRKSGQDPADLKARKDREAKADFHGGGANENLDSFGDEGEIALDFEVLSDKISEMTKSANAAGPTKPAREDKEKEVLYDDGEMQYFRSKDAGKTCKERFSFSSFDAGATVLKTNPGAKNAKSILVENKDSYMLFECATENKFVIVELSDDILVDTVVLANFEFFSSMVRRFRVSVSDRYPVKVEKWKEVGVFEARNSRDIQPFLVQHPKIWAKYIRIEFLSQYGNEFYCPLSLLRVHGTRMLDTWKESEGGSGYDDGEETIDAPVPEPVEGPGPAEVVMPNESEPVVFAEEILRVEDPKECVNAPGMRIFNLAQDFDTCEVQLTTTEPTATQSQQEDATSESPSSVEPIPSTVPPSDHVGTSETSESASEPSPCSDSSRSVPPVKNATSSVPTSAATDNIVSNATQTQPTQSHNRVGESSSATSSPTPAPPPPPQASKPTATQGAKNKTSSATGSASAASPTVQESFFKAFSKRLSLLESNTSLSLKYIEDQSRFLQDALLKMEKKQITRVDRFLDDLNQTVLSELRSVRTQYDQMWQSTVLALDTQRDQSQRELVALTARLNLLADEVVFQKRMAIVQAVLLLACLALVVFSRGLVGSTLDAALHYHQHVRRGSGGGGGVVVGASPPPSSVVRVPGTYSPVPTPLRARLRADSVESRNGAALAPDANRGGPVPRGSLAGLTYADKSLPLTPVSGVAVETTPSVRVDGASGLGDAPDMMQQVSALADDQLVGLDLVNGESLDASVEDFQSDISDISSHGSNPPLSRSTLAQSGPARKPLPALPEDPT